MTDKVVHAFPVSDLPENLMQIDPPKVGAVFYCQHEAIRIDPHERLVFCSRCDATLDPFNFLLNNAVTVRSAWENFKQAKLKVSDLHERIESLTKEERRLKDRVKRLQEKLPTIDLRERDSK